MGLFDAIFGSGGDNELGNALAQYNNISLPELKELDPELYQKVVSLNPELETAVKLGPSAMEGISTDPMAKQAQLDALRKLQDIGSGEQTISDISRQAQLESDVNRNLKGQQDAIMQNLAVRGMSGGGNELVARQLSAQEGANRQAQMELDLKAQAERKALEALMQSGQLGSQIQQQEFGQKAQVAGAQDAISRFNAQNQQQVQSRNIANKNAAQEWNANQSQNIANQNTQVRNAYNERNAELGQRRFDNQVRLADSKSGVYGQQAASRSADRDREANFVGGLIGAGATLLASDKRVKKDIKPLDVSELLSKLSGYEFKYKKPELLNEEDTVNASVMAQDLEKSKIGKGMVHENENGVKLVDAKKAAMAALASLAEINKRLEKVEKDK